MNIPVATVGAATAGVLDGLERLQGPVTVVRRCTELTELIAVSQSGIVRAAVVADEAGELTAALAERLAAAGVALVALADDPILRQRLEALRIVNAPSGVDPGALADLISAAVQALEQPVQDTRTGGSNSLADPAAAFGAGTAAPGPDDTALPEGRRGTVTAVWGPAGAPGRTTLAVNLAAEAAAAGTAVLLIDADTYGSSVAVSLGLLDESAGLAQACRLADQGLLDDAALRRISAGVSLRGHRLSVLTGITRSDRWVELRPAALAGVLAAARRIADLIIVDCGFSLETDEELSFDTMAPRRNASTLLVLEAADTVYAVGTADSVGVPRLVRALADLAGAVPGLEPRVVLNKVRASSVGRQPESQLRGAWERFGPGGEIAAFLPADYDAADASLLSGTALLETAPASALRASIAELAGVQVPGRRRGAPRTRAK
ncbi:chromosome partitioning protein [Arthrobacter zhaoxinii]|uniref:Chromosome partitioning protein n=1 Tax=Arthrobacter zhaoxinii TaxID=2964616 RepID=A0ABY5YNR0_9MICC|nr:chromosome partitioning protein [Arthrobacter zhaoxinii]UWX96308.1 chromosome partitioning protein [Arthrobacter zhaoxinii]